MKLKSSTLNKKQKKNLRKKINLKKKKLAQKVAPSHEGEGAATQSEAATIEEEKPKSTVPAPENTQHMSNTALFSQPDTKLLDKNKLMRGPSLDENFKLKIADLGNACWTYHHFATEI